jgi:hypothetical protein
MRLVATLTTSTCLFLFACSNNVEQTSTSSGSTTATGDATTTASTGGAGGTGGSVSTTVTTTSSTGGEGGAGEPSTKYPAFTSAGPRVVTYGGSILKSPKIVPITFLNETADMVTAINTFTQQIGPSDYWKAIATEYDVGPASSLTPIQVQENADKNITDDQIQTWLQAKLADPESGFPAPTANTLYAIYYPAGTTITQGGDKSCQSFGGYHNETSYETSYNGAKIAYSVVPHCNSFGQLTPPDSVTGAAAHEYIEASTDPYPNTVPAFASTDNNDIYWVFALGGGEVGDMCAQDPRAFTTFAGIDYVVQRSWSNKAIAGGHNPCVPNDSAGTYFNAIPVLNDKIPLDPQKPAQGSFKGVKIAEGASKTIDLELFSDAATGPFAIQVFDGNELMGQNPELSFSLDQDKGQNGQKLHLTITVDQASQYGIEVFAIFASQGNQQNTWFGAVGN